MEMETQQPLKLQVIFTRTMVAPLIANWLQTKVPPRMISKRYVTVSVRRSALTQRMFRAAQLKTLCTLRAAAAAACLGDCHPKVENADG